MLPFLPHFLFHSVSSWGVLRFDEVSVQIFLFVLHGEPYRLLIFHTMHACVHAHIMASKNSRTEAYLEFSSYPLLPEIVQLLETYVVATAHNLLQHEMAVFLQNELEITWCMIRRVW
jgi:hypothetical protein